MADIKFTSNVNDILRRMEKGKRNALTAIGSSAETHAKDNITADDLIDTGRLRNSISYAVDGEAAYIGTNVEYAPYLELGTKKITAHHYLKRAATEHKDEYKELTAQAIQSAINNSQ